jgi:hypothetical protein
MVIGAAAQLGQEPTAVTDDGSANLNLKFGFWHTVYQTGLVLLLLKVYKRLSRPPTLPLSRSNNTLEQGI